MKPFLLTGLSLLLCAALPAQPTIQERLGYAKDAKLLIIHADDLGVAHAENAASLQLLETGSARSASIMVPCPWFTEMAAYAAAHPAADLGLHLTLTSEWKHYKWGPVSGATVVPGLVNAAGYFYASADSVYRTASAGEVETELRRQMERARDAGIDFTHLDAHMGVVYGNIDYLKAAIRLGREYKVPMMLTRTTRRSPFNDELKAFLTDKEVLADTVYAAGPADYRNGMANYYAWVLQSLRPGLSIIILHAAYDNDEMQAITADHEDWGAAWRQADYDFFSGDRCKTLLKDHDIRVITWREVRDKLLR